MSNWGQQGQILGPQLHRVPMAKLFMLSLSDAPWCQSHVLSGRSQIELKVLFLTKNTMFQKLLFKKKKILFKPISDHFWKTNDSNVNFLSELSYVPSSLEQKFEKVTNTDIVKSPDYFQLFPLISIRYGVQCFTSAVYFLHPVSINYLEWS